MVFRPWTTDCAGLQSQRRETNEARPPAAPGKGKGGPAPLLTLGLRPGRKVRCDPTSLQVAPSYRFLQGRGGLADPQPTRRALSRVSRVQFPFPLERGLPQHSAGSSPWSSQGLSTLPWAGPPAARPCLLLPILHYGVRGTSACPPLYPAPLAHPRESRWEAPHGRERVQSW